MTASEDYFREDNAWPTPMRKEGEHFRWRLYAVDEILQKVSVCAFHVHSKDYGAERSR